MSRSSACRRMATGLLCALGAGLATAGPASAGVADQMWNCRASASYTDTPGQDRNEPVVANGSSRTSVESPDRARCADDEARPVAAGQGLDLQGPTASTSIDPDSGLAVDQRVVARSAVNDATSSSGGFVLVARVANAEATASCTGSTPTLAGSSRVERVLVNGEEVDPSAAQEAVYNLPTGEVVKVYFNRQTRTGSSLIQRAVHMEYYNQAGELVRETAIAESKVSGGSEVCNRAAQEDADGGDGNGNAEPCITGAEYDALHNLCIITRERDNNLANGRETVAIVGRPFEGPSGGRVAPPNEAPKSARKSRCVKGKNLKFLILGSKKADRITGSNRSDVIFTFGGNDQISSGRGNDCIVGGKGSDRLTGGLGKDTILGGKGRDNLNGSTGADRMWGGAGNDTLNAAYGRDKVKGGGGNDAINVATAGPAARVNCGKGKDVVRSNMNERRRIRGCERRYSIR
jgi:hemolysin type calcium-binding protein